MSISASTIAQSLHSAFHRSDAQQTAPMQRRQQFERQIQAAQHGQSASASSAAGAGSLLSSDMLKAVQTIG